MFLLRDYLVDILLIVYAFKNIFQILRSDKVNAPFPANRYPKYKEVIAICNTPGIPFFRFLISFDPFAVSHGAIRRPVSARHCLRMRKCSRTAVQWRLTPLLSETIRTNRDK